MSRSDEWNSIKMVEGKPAFFTTKVYNSIADGRPCEPGAYSIELKLMGSDFAFGDIFDGNVQPDSFMLGENEDRLVLITLTPKVNSGQYIVDITVKRQSPEIAGGGVGFSKTTSARINIIVGDEATANYSNVPFWKIRKDCPGGFVVTQDENCPRVCKNGDKANEEGKCLEDVEQPKVVVVENEKLVPGGPTAFFILGGLQLSFESFILLLAVIITVCIIAFFLLYTKNLKKQLRGGLR